MRNSLGLLEDCEYLPLSTLPFAKRGSTFLSIHVLASVEYIFIQETSVFRRTFDGVLFQPLLLILLFSLHDTTPLHATVIIIGVLHCHISRFCQGLPISARFKALSGNHLLLKLFLYLVNFLIIPPLLFLATMSLEISSGPPIGPFRTDMIDTNPWREKMPTELMQRTAFGRLGKPATININSYPVAEFPTKQVYQYNVSAAPDNFDPVPC